MAALGVGDQVVATAALLGGDFISQRELPQFGFVESLTPGPPPTAVTVVWSDGLPTLYAAVNDGAASVLAHVVSAAQPILLNYVVQPVPGGSIPNPGGRLSGPVVQQYGLEDPSGTFIDEVVVVETPIGVLVLPYAAVVVVPNA